MLVSAIRRLGQDVERGIRVRVYRFDRGGEPRATLGVTEES